MTRRKNSPQKKEAETVLSATELQNMDYNSMSESQFRSTIIKLLVALEKSIKDSRDFMTAEFRSNQAEIKNQLNEMQSGIPGWLSGLVPAFGPGCAPGVPGSSPTSGSLHGAASPPACVSASLPLCVSHE